jgi:hypothetical protein
MHPTKFPRFLLLFLLLAPAASCNKQVTVPSELVGSWVTQDARYRSKTLEIDGDGFVILFFGEDIEPKAERIDAMSTKTEAGITTYTFDTCDQADVHDKIRVNYRPVNGGELRLAHPNQVVWHRAVPGE